MSVCVAVTTGNKVDCPTPCVCTYRKAGDACVANHVYGALQVCVVGALLEHHNARAHVICKHLSHKLGALVGLRVCARVCV